LDGCGAYPGAQLLIGTHDGIIFEKSFGNYTYDEFSAPVTDESIYDLASVTKVVATTSAVMKLYEAGLIDLNSRVSIYLPDFVSNGKEDVTVLNLLLHNSGLEAFVPFFTMYTKEK
jgi:CubicO group peptidase (beta-lactamase class C family)